MTADESFMREALRLARKGAGRTEPNPAVGCLIVRDGRIVGRGWHRKAGQPHAEVEALRSLRDRKLARGATAYVTLEPCSSYGRTPPCTEALIASGVGRVVFGATDPDPRHRGRGLSILRAAGISVRQGVLAQDCAALNPEFHHAMSTGVPWVIAKCGLSLDGRLTRPPGESRIITSAASRRDAMKLRARVDAILVGAGTVRADDPQLTVRGVGAMSQPLRAVWAPRGAPPAGARLFRDRHKDRTVVLGQASLEAALRALGASGVRSVLIEGGGHTLGCLFDLGLANEVVFYIGSRLAGGEVPAVGGRGRHRPLRLLAPEVRRIGNDLRVAGVVHRAQLRTLSRHG